MPTLVFETRIAAPLARVWAFHQDVKTALPALSRPGDQVEVEEADLPVGLGSRLVIRAKGPVGRVRWVAKYVEFVPPHAVVFGEEARFVDEQEAGPFKRWRHSHEFDAIDDRTTRLVDRITYQVPYGPFGWIADKLLIGWTLRAMFRYRHTRTREILEST